MTKLKPLNGNVPDWLDSWVKRFQNDHDGCSRSEVIRAGLKVLFLQRYPDEFGRILEAERELEKLKNANGGT